MKCTVCSDGRLEASYLEPLLPCHTCSNCGGSLLRMMDYFRWQSDSADSSSSDEASHSLANPSVNPVVDVAEETRKAVICPKSGVLMTKYRISAETDNRLDYSAASNAVWIDKGEWALLKANGLATRLNNVFTSHWQHEIRAQESSEVMEELYKRRFGEHYTALKAFREVLDSMEDRNEALAYLMAEDPYQP